MVNAQCVIRDPGLQECPIDTSERINLAQRPPPTQRNEPGETDSKKRFVDESI